MFRQRLSVPSPALELALRSLHVLLSTGWHTDISPELGVQLLILLTSIACNDDGQVKFSSWSDDLLCLDFSCLAAIFQSLLSSQPNRDALVTARNVPALGHTITGVLDAIAKSEATKLSKVALHALDVIISGLDRKVLSSFLPGITSSLTKALTPSSTQRRPYQILVEGTKLLSRMLEKTLSNHLSFPKAADNMQPSSVSSSPQLNEAWLKGTGGQVKLALANIIKQRRHSREEVRRALQNLCLTILRRCDQHLADCIPLMLDTLIVLIPGAEGSTTISHMSELLIEHPQYSEHLQNSLHSHLLGLPRLMLSNDMQAKSAHVKDIRTIIDLLIEADAGLDVAEDEMTVALRESLAGSLRHHERTMDITQQPVSSIGLWSSETGSMSAFKAFPSLLATTKTDHDNEALILELVSTLSKATTSGKATQVSLDQLSTSQPADLIVNFWLALQMLRSRVSSESDVDEFLNEEMVETGNVSERDELYSFAISTLAQEEDESTFTDDSLRLRLLALEAVEFQASILKKAFRPEFADALYPLLHHLGSSIPQMRSHAMIALNRVARSTGYSSSQELVMDNNDYLVNGIGMKLNTFELSPQAPRVLNMLVRLSGAKLLPYLDDLTDNIFEALECYHGYDSLVGLLFQCLGAMVEEGAQAPALLIESSGGTGSHRLEPLEPTTPSGLALMLRQSKGRALGQKSEGRPSAGVQDQLPEETPQKPWKELAENGEPNPEDDEQSTLGANAKASLSSSYHLIHRIARLTQHHLPSSNTLIRSHLSHVLSVAMPYLAQHEDTFLPLIHTLWPVLVPRLRDQEVGVVSGTLDVMAKMTEGSGSFVRGRIAGIWEDIKDVHRRAHRGLQAPSNHLSGPKVIEHRAPLQATTQRPLEPGSLRLAGRSNATKSQISVMSSGDDHLADEISLSVSSTRALTRKTAEQLDDYDPSHNPQSFSKGNTYFSSSSIALYRALTSFLISLMTHVDVEAWMFDEVLSDMLLPYLVSSPVEAPWMEEKTRQRVQEILEERNGDAVWLLKLRHGLLPDEERRLRYSRPENVDGAISFSKVGKVN